MCELGVARCEGRRSSGEGREFGTGRLECFGSPIRPTVWGNTCIRELRLSEHIHVESLILAQDER